MFYKNRETDELYIVTESGEETITLALVDDETNTVEVTESELNDLFYIVDDIITNTVNCDACSSEVEVDNTYYATGILEGTLRKDLELCESCYQANFGDIKFIRVPVQEGNLMEGFDPEALAGIFGGFGGEGTSNLDDADLSELNEALKGQQ